MDEKQEVFEKLLPEFIEEGLGPAVNHADTKKTLDFYHIEAYREEIVELILDKLLAGEYNKAYVILGALKQVETCSEQSSSK